MDRLIYTALTGLQRNQEAQAVTSHNLANANTPGFRREMAELSSGWITANGSALTARVQSGGEAPHDLLRAGAIEITNDPLHVAMNGGAWLAVADGNGNEALTRRGDLRVDAEGNLLTGDNHPVMGEDGPIHLGTGFENLTIARDGAVTTRLADDQPWVTVARLKLVSPDPASLARGPDGLFRSPTQEPDPTASVTPGAIERSNVETTAALVELIEQSRSFEMQTKLLSAAREMDEGTAQLMRVQ